MPQQPPETRNRCSACGSTSLTVLCLECTNTGNILTANGWGITPENLFVATAKEHDNEAWKRKAQDIWRQTEPWGFPQRLQVARKRLAQAITQTVIDEAPYEPFALAVYQTICERLNYDLAAHKMLLHYVPAYKKERTHE